MPALQSSPDVAQEGASQPSWWVRVRTWIGAWQPFTGGGVAAFAGATLLRVFWFQLAFAALGVAALLISLRLAWVPAIEAALQQLPAEGAEIRAGQLTWPDPKPVLLAGRPQLALGVDPVEPPSLGQNGDLQLELRRSDWRVRGVFGFLALPYPTEESLSLTRTGAAAAWEAWRPPLTGAVALAMLLCQLALWWLLATGYFLPVWALAGIFRRRGGAAHAWKLAAASLLPASLLLDAALLLYATGAVGIGGLGGIAATAIPAGWFWIAWGLLNLEGRGEPAKPAKNPFQAATAVSDAPKPTKAKKQNPFDQQ